MCKLEQMYEIQKNFTKKFFKIKTGTDFNKIKENKKELVKWNKEYILALIKEVTEILDELDWKSHTSKDSQSINDNILEESIDVLKYLFGLMMINGFSVDDIFNKFLDKSLVVEAKFKQEIELNEILNKNKKIAIIDIDGILASWPKTFINFVNEKTNNNFKSYKDLRNNLERLLMFNLKEQYRLSGIKKEMDVLFDATKFTKFLKKENYSIIIVTARPYEKYFRIYSDTLNWLNKNNILYDAIIWKQEKEKYIIEHFKKENVAFCIDDDIDNINKLTTSGFKTFYIPNELMFNNRKELKKEINNKLNKNTNIVNNLNSIKEILCKEKK